MGGVVLGKLGYLPKYLSLHLFGGSRYLVSGSQVPGSMWALCRWICFLCLSFHMRSVVWNKTCPFEKFIVRIKFG